MSEMSQTPTSSMSNVLYTVILLLSIVALLEIISLVKAMRKTTIPTANQALESANTAFESANTTFELASEYERAPGKAGSYLKGAESLLKKM